MFVETECSDGGTRAKEPDQGARDARIEALRAKGDREHARADQQCRAVCVRDVLQQRDGAQRGRARTSGKTEDERQLADDDVDGDSGEQTIIESMAPAQSASRHIET